MAKKKKAAKKRKPLPKPKPKKTVTVTVIKKATIGKPKKAAKKKGASYHIKAATDLLYDEMANLYTRKEKAAKKSAKKKLQKQIMEKKRQINRLK